MSDESLLNACAGATYVMHLATPFFFGNSEAELVTPAVEGTLSIMRACKANNVRRCVVTSSIASVIYPAVKPTKPIDETTWSSTENANMGVYPKSKLLAEKAAWDFQAELPEAERFELVTIMPSFILGPALKTESSVSIDFCRKILNGEMTEVSYKAFPMVDVRDLAQALL